MVTLMWLPVDPAPQGGALLDTRFKPRFNVDWQKPEFQYFEAPIVIDNATKEVIDNAA